jgi:hypothetical protein
MMDKSIIVVSTPPPPPPLCIIPFQNNGKTFKTGVNFFSIHDLLGYFCKFIFIRSMI